MRRIGRLRSEASPSNVAVIAWPPTTPIISREPVPALPKSSVSRGASSEPRPGPATRPAPGAEPLDRRAERRGRPRRCAARRRPRAGPRSRVSPRVSRPNRKARCEIDLSPGGRTRPRERGRRWRAAAGARRRGDMDGHAAIARARRRDAARLVASRRTRAVERRRETRLTRAPSPTNRGAPNPALATIREPNSRGQTRARSQAPVPELRRQVLRSEQGSDRLPEMRHGLPGRRRCAPSASARRRTRRGRS